MNQPIEIYSRRPEGELIEGYACGKCGTLHVGAGKAETAARCCNPRCGNCGNPCEKPYIDCRDCRFAASSKREAQTWTQAEKLTEWDGPVFVEDWEEYYSSLGDLHEAIDDRGRPERIYACVEEPVGPLSAETVAEWVTSEMHEDAFDQLVGLEDLQKHLDAWVAAQPTVSWVPDMKRGIVLPSVEDADA